MPRSRSGSIALDQLDGLAQRLAARERGADEELVVRFRSRLRGVLRKRLHDPGAADEVADDVLLAVIGAVGAGRLLDAAKLPAFVMGAARNLANAYLRRRGRQALEGCSGLEAAVDDAAETMRGREQRRRVFDEAQHLDDFDRSIVGLTLAQGLKPSEIARVLRMSPAVVRTRKCRAIRWLAGRLRTPDSPAAM